jgi:hypothetical protein
MTEEASRRVGGSHPAESGRQPSVEYVSTGRHRDLIGVESQAGVVVLETALGIQRSLDMMSGEQLPRIC